MILGLDVSTSITGATLLDDNGNIILCEAWDTRNKNRYEDLFAKADQIRFQLWKMGQYHNIEKIYIEQSLQSFRSGFSSAQTLSTLSRFNGIVSWLCYRTLKIKPEYIAATSARKTCGIKVAKGKKAKEVVLKYLLDNEQSFSIEYTKHGNPKPGSYDQADSIVIARAGYILCQNSKSSTS
tara:strand:- start:581 stop:1123 length:543 start_codon:yes stop_codon:yes gene_type:complete